MNPGRSGVVRVPGESRRDRSAYSWMSWSSFDALTGAGLRGRACTWTASSYLLLAEAHESRLGKSAEA